MMTSFNSNVLFEMKESVIDTISDRDLLVKKLSSFANDKKGAENNLIAAKEAQKILKEVARETQSEIEEHLSNIVTMALAAVEVDDPDIPKPPEFVVKMVSRRDGTECDLMFKEGDREQHPFDCSGFGYVDIADYALRIDFILLEDEYGEEEIRRTLILDEPFRNVDSKLQFKVGEMCSMMSKELKFQQLIASHSGNVNIAADKTFHVVKSGKISKITENSS